MNTEFMTADTNLPPCLPLPGAMLGLPVSSTAKVMYAKLLGAVLTAGVEDANGILFVRFPPCRAGYGAGAQYADLQAGRAGIVGRRTDPAGTPGDRSAEPDLCAGAEEELNKILRYAIMESKKSALPYSEECREAARKFAREHKYHSESER